MMKAHHLIRQMGVYSFVHLSFTVANSFGHFSVLIITAALIM